MPQYSPTAILITIQYSVTVIYGYITSEKHAIRFFTHVITSDAIMGFKNLPFVRNAVLVPLYIFYLIWGFALYYRWVDLIRLPTIIMLLATDFNALCTGILFFGLYERMQLIQRTLENNFVPVNIVGQDQLQKNVKIVRKCVGYYSNLLDSFDAVETQLQVMVSGLMKVIEQIRCSSLHKIATYEGVVLFLKIYSVIFLGSICVALPRAVLVAGI
ncbi:hypothetical protein B5X24_HaOG200957 [Helicoverpa armigera]|nr:hypothetical protein B5X24_HaOG200957 [Helicoverpa armigera]